jgi:hypothetical protein
MARSTPGFFLRRVGILAHYHQRGFVLQPR